MAWKQGQFDVVELIQEASIWMLNMDGMTHLDFPLKVVKIHVRFLDTLVYIAWHTSVSFCLNR